MTFAIECYHSIVSANEADAEGSAVEDRSDFILRLESCSALPHIVTHHEGELTRQSRALIEIALVELLPDKGGHRADGFEEILLCLLLLLLQCCLR